MKIATVWLLCAVSLVGTHAARADESIAPAPAGLALRGTEVHSAARLLAAGAHLNLIVVGGGARVNASFGVADVSTTLQKLADAAGLAVAKRGAFWVMAPKATIDALPARLALSGGREVNLDFVQVDAANLFKLLGDIGRKHVTSPVTGGLSLYVRNVKSWEVAALVAALAGASVRSHARAVELGEGALPAPSEPPVWPCTLPEWSGQLMPPRISCVPTEKLELVGVYLRGVNGLALVRGIDAKTGDPRAELVRAGDRVGAGNVRVSAVRADAVELDGGTVLRLAHD